MTVGPMLRKPARPVTVELLVRAAQTYLSRRAASRLQLERVLTRKARRNADPDAPFEAAALTTMIAQAVERIVQAGWIDEAALAETRAHRFARQGLPTHRIRRRLTDQGLPLEQQPAGLLDLDDEAQARRYAERKRLGPFASGLRVPSFDRDLRAMVRAGFDPRLATRVLRDPID